MNSRILAITFLSLLPATMYASAGSVAASDSVRPPHLLREVEVLGLKHTDDDAEAVTVVDGAEARRLGIDAMRGLAEIAPNFYMPQYGSRMTSSIYVRGLGARMDQPVVGLTVDNVPVLNKDAYDFDIAEIDRMEVMRGAQAVLGGRNTMGGQINIRTLSPLTTKGLRASAGYGNGNTVKASAAYYNSFTDLFGMSLAGQFNHTDGFFRNEHTGKLLDHENSGSLRWKTVWRPLSRLSFTNTASLSLADQGGYPYRSLETGKIAYNDTCSYRRTVFADGLTVAWAGKRVVVTSLTSVQYIDDDMHLDQDFLTDEYFTLRQKNREWTVTEDLFTRGERGAYSWLGGVWAFYRTSDMHAPVNFKDTGIERLIEEHRNNVNPDYPIRWDTRSFTLGSEFTRRTVAAAVYHQSAFTTGLWRFEVGLRLDIERNALDYRSNCNTGYTTMHILPDGAEEVYSHTPIVIDDGASMGKTFVEFIPKFTASYNWEPLAPYINISKGYKAGGYNTQMFSDVLQQRIMSIMGIAAPYSLEQIVSYDPERSMNYEIGFHSSLLDRRLKIDGTFFFIDCRNQQLTVFPAGTTTGRIMTNAGRTRSLGAELTAEWTVVEDVNLRASYGYTNATFRKYNNGLQDFRGKRVPYAPANTLFAEIGWRASRLSFAGITPTLSVSTRGAGSIYWNEENSLRQPFYAMADIALVFAAEKWSLRLWCDNLTGTRYNTFYFMSIGNAFLQEGMPRTFGAALRIRI